MLRWVLAVLLLIPLVDVLVLVYVAGVIGAVATVALVVLTGLIGLLLVRAEGRHTLRKIQRRVAAGEAPTDELLDGALLIAAGAFLLTPGLVTDAVGVLLVVPPSRYLVRRAVKRWAVVPVIDARTGGFATGAVYGGGFPDERPGAGDPDEAGGTGGAYDLGPDAYDIDFDDDEGNGKA